MTKFIILLLFTLPTVYLLEDVNVDGSESEFEVLSGGQDGYCPHPDFVTKHVCSSCRSTEDAARFADKVYKRYRQSAVSSVFAGSGIYYDRRKAFCFFSAPVRKYYCTMNNSAWTCRDSGSAIAKHSITNGHLS